MHEIISMLGEVTKWKIWTICLWKSEEIRYCDFSDHWAHLLYQPQIWFPTVWLLGDHESHTSNFLLCGFQEIVKACGPLVHFIPVMYWKHLWIHAFFFYMYNFDYTSVLLNNCLVWKFANVWWMVHNVIFDILFICKENYINEVKKWMSAAVFYSITLRHIKLCCLISDLFAVMFIASLLQCT